MLHSMDPKKLNKKEGPSKDAPITPKRENEIVTNSHRRHTRGRDLGGEGHGGGSWASCGIGQVERQEAGPVGQE